MSPDPALVMRNLSVEYDGRAALRSVDLTVSQGEVLALLGPSGAGKSTALHVVAGFHAPATGEIYINGELVASPSYLEVPNRRDVAVVFQNYALWPHMSALDTVAYPVRRRGLSRSSAQAEAMEILDRLNIAHLAHRRPSELSGGEQQRVGLARALARRASLYLFDEPTAHLDSHLRVVFLEEMVSRLRASGAAALYSTHDAEEALGLADRVALLHDGRVVQVGTPQQVYDEPADAWVARLTGPASVISSPAGPGHVLVRPDWAYLGGPLEGRLLKVWFRGPHSDHLVESRFGTLLLREPGPPAHRAGQRVSWGLRRSWPVGGGEDQAETEDQISSSFAGPE
ncbi:MAG TPA: ABC transporter ATP-binding protein [Nocardioidaceae bacterium]|nr:ABC transporter ATP-binding protein [Nocardioidaceae bacterium]